MVDLLALDGTVTASIAHPYYVCRYKVMVININLVKYHSCSESDVLPYALVKDYSFGGSDVRSYIHMSVRMYEINFQHQMVYYSILTPYYTHSIV